MMEISQFRSNMKRCLVITWIFQSFFYSPAFADELTIYSSEGIQKISIPELADTKTNQNTYRFVGEKCILNCKEEVPKIQPTDKTLARETSDSKEKPEQSITINIYPSEPNPSQYIIVPYKKPHRDHKPPDRLKPPMHPSINSGTSSISDRFPLK